MKTHRFSQFFCSMGVALVMGLSTWSSSACATCFGQTDSPLGRGLNWGIFALLAVVGSVLAGICSFFVFLARRSAKLDAEDQLSTRSNSTTSSLPATGLIS